MIARRGQLALLLCFALSACGDLPEPFLGNPGATARRLARPLTPLLAVPPGTDTLLPDAANQALANHIATALQASEVPAMVRTPEKTDWRLITRAERTGDFVTPLFRTRKARRRAVPKANRCRCKPGAMPMRRCSTRLLPRPRRESVRS
jgi:hypothetical protein